MPWIALVPDISGVCSVFGTFEITSKPTNAASTRIASSVRRSISAPPSRRRRATQAPLITSSSKSSLQRALVAGHQLDQRLHVARVQLRRVLRHPRRQVQRARDDHAAVGRVRLARPGELAVAARLGGEVDDHAAGPHRRATASAEMSFGAGRPGTSAVVMITSDLPICTVSAWRWVSCSSARQLAGVAAAALGVAEPLDLEEPRAERLDLLLHGACARRTR